MPAQGKQGILRDIERSDSVLGRAGLSAIFGIAQIGEVFAQVGNATGAAARIIIGAELSPGVAAVLGHCTVVGSLGAVGLASSSVNAIENYRETGMISGSDVAFVGGSFGALGYARFAAPRSTALIPVGKYLNTVDDVLVNPQLLNGKTAAEVQAILGKTPGWSVETLGKGAHQGQGWVLREYNAAGNPTGRMLRWHPGGGHNGPNPYWRVNSHNTKSPIIPAGPES